MYIKIIGISAVIAALILGAHASGLVNLKAVPKELGITDEIEPCHIIVAADITAGRENELKKDFDAIQKLIGKAGAGDKIEVYLIHSRAESSQEAIFSTEMPGDPGPMGMMLSRTQDTAKQSFKELWSKSISAFLGDHRLVQQTDLFGFLRFVSQKREFRKSKKPSLILLTDGQQVGDGFNFERAVPDERDLIKARKADLIADLGGISITLAGFTPTHDISNSHWRKLVSWWRAYLKEADAEIAVITSERNL